MSARNDFLAALRALLPPASDGTVSVVRAGEPVTVSLTLPGREKPITTATVRTAQKASAAQGDLFEPRPEGAPEAPSTPAAPDTPTPVVVVGATTAEAALAIPPITQAGRELRVGDRVFVDGDERIWTVYLYIEDRVSLVDGDSKTTCSLAREDITLSPGGVWCCASVELLDETSAGHPAGVSQTPERHPSGVSETPATGDGGPRKSPWMLFSVEVHDREASPVLWAMQKGLRWALGGVVFWHIEGGASKRCHHRMVTIIPRERCEELFELCADAKLAPDMRDVDHGGGLLHLRSVVREEAGGAAWSVTAIDRAMQRVELARDEGRETRSVPLVLLDKSYDGTGDFVLVSTAPSKVSTSKPDAKPSKKAAKGTSAPKVNPPKIPEGSALASTSSARPPQRVLIVHDKGGDSLGARKGLAAWSAEKTLGAGAQSGGELRPLVMLHTPLVDSGDIEKLLARYAKVKRLVLDLGVIAGEDLAAHWPSQPEIRMRWNAAHPAARVEVPEAPKAPRTKKGGAK